MGTAYSTNVARHLVGKPGSNRQVEDIDGDRKIIYSRRVGANLPASGQGQVAGFFKLGKKHDGFIK